MVLLSKPNLFFNYMKHQKAIKAVLLAASSLTVMSGAIIAPALPEISRYFAGDNTDFLTKLVLTMPALVIALLAPVAGYLTDRFGRKKLLIISLLIYGLAGTMGFLLDDLMLLLVSRAVLGVGVAGIMNVATTLIGDYFQGEERSRFMGLQASFMALGGVVFLNVGGILADWSWRGPFLVYTAALVILPFAIRFIVEPTLNEAKKQVTDRSNDSARRQQKRVITFIYVMGFLGMIFFYMVPVQIPFLLTQQTEVSNTLVGLAVSVATVTGAIASMNYARVKARTTFANVYALSFLLMAAGYSIISLGDQYWLIAVGLAVSGFGTGFLMPNGNLWLIDSTDESSRGRAIGGLSSAIFLGQFLSPIAIAPVVRWTSLNNTFLIAAFLLVGIAIGIYFMEKTKRMKVTNKRPA